MLVHFYAFRSFHCMERSSLNTLSNISFSVLQKKGLELYGDEQMMMKYSSLDKPSHPNVRALLKPWPSGLCMCSKTCRIQTHSPLSPIFPVKVACVERNIGPIHLSGPVWDAPAVFFWGCATAIQQTKLCLRFNF